jgi:hypothetical protein
MDSTIKDERANSPSGGTFALDRREIAPGVNTVIDVLVIFHVASFGFDS